MSSQRTIMLAAATALTALVMFAVGGELMCRFFFPDYLKRQYDERNTLFRYDQELGWFPIEGSSGTYSASRTVSVLHNSEGFRDREHGPKDRPRIAVIGDLFVWGFDVERHERFTEHLDTLLTDWDVMNMGVSGYSSDQEFLLIQKYFETYQPDIVLVIYCLINDEKDNTLNMISGGYYKPYFTAENGVLTLHGVPVPRSIGYFYARYPVWSESYLVRAIATLYYELVNPGRTLIRDPMKEIFLAMRDYVASRGARLIVGLQDDKLKITRFLDAEEFAYIQLKNPYFYPEYGNHWTPEGHRYVSRKVYDFLIQNGYVNSR